MFYDPDAPKVPGQPDYSKGCIVDLPEDMRAANEIQAATMPTMTDAQSTATASTTTTTTSGATSSTESDSTSPHSPHSTPSHPQHRAAAASVPSNLGAEDMSTFYPTSAAASHEAPFASLHSARLLPSASPSGHSAFLTSISPYLSVLYAVLAVVVVASFYFIPMSRTRVKQQASTDSQQQAIRRILTAVQRKGTLQQQMTTTTNGALPSLTATQPPFLPTSPHMARYTANASTIPSHISSHFTPLELSHAIRVILAGFDEDVDSGDITTLSTIPSSSSSSARFLAKETGTISGIHVVDLVFHLYDPQLSTTWSVTDGTSVKAGTVVGVVTGSSRSLLTSERLALNLLQRMSGIASHTAELRRLIEAVNSPTLLLDTRKTAPGMRMLDKMAVRAGGAVNHRIGLYDMVMIKDNHITAAGGIPQAINQVKQWCVKQQRTVPIEVETRTIDEVKQLLTYLKTEDKITYPPVTRIMLDNMVRVTRNETTGEVTEVDVSMLKEAVQMLKNDVLGRDLESEASGNVTAGTIGRIAETQVTFISVGAVTHSVKALDISLKIQ